MPAEGHHGSSLSVLTITDSDSMATMDLTMAGNAEIGTWAKVRCRRLLLPGPASPRALHMLAGPPSRRMAGFRKETDPNHWTRTGLPPASDDGLPTKINLPHGQPPFYWAHDNRFQGHVNANPSPERVCAM